MLDEIRVSVPECARFQVVFERCERPRDHVRIEPGEGRDTRAYPPAEIRLGSAPAGAQEPVGAVMRNRHDAGLATAERFDDLPDGTKPRAVDLRALGQVVADEPKCV